MEMAAVSRSMKKAKLYETINAADDRSPAHSNESRQSAERRVALGGFLIVVIEKCASNAPVAILQFSSETERLKTQEYVQGLHSHLETPEFSSECRVFFDCSHDPRSARLYLIARPARM